MSAARRCGPAAARRSRSSAPALAGWSRRTGRHGQDGRSVRPGDDDRHGRPGRRRRARPRSPPRPWWSTTAPAPAARPAPTMVAKSPRRRQDARDGHGRHARDQRRRSTASCPYDTMRDFAPVAFVGYTPTLLVVAADSPVQVAEGPRGAGGAARKASTFASAGNGTSGHLAGELLAQRLGGKMIHVPVQGRRGRDDQRDVARRSTSCSITRPPSMPQIKAGKLRAIGASSAVRSAAAPDVPTLMELGVKDFDLVAWFMLYAPAGDAAGDARATAQRQRRRAGPARRGRAPARAGHRAAGDARRRAGAVQQDRAREVGRAGQALRRADRLTAGHADRRTDTTDRRRPMTDTRTTHAPHRRRGHRCATLGGLGRLRAARPASRSASAARWR